MHPMHADTVVDDLLPVLSVKLRHGFVVTPAITKTVLLSDSWIEIVLVLHSSSSLTVKLLIS